MEEIRAFLHEHYPYLLPTCLTEDGTLYLEAYQSCTGSCDTCPQQCLVDDREIRQSLFEAFPALRDIHLTQAISDETIDFAKKILGLK